MTSVFFSITHIFSEKPKLKKKKWFNNQEKRFILNFACSKKNVYNEGEKHGPFLASPVKMSSESSIKSPAFSFKKLVLQTCFMDASSFRSFRPKPSRRPRPHYPESEKRTRQEHRGTRVAKPRPCGNTPSVAMNRINLSAPVKQCLSNFFGS